MGPETHPMVTVSRTFGVGSADLVPKVYGTCSWIMLKAAGLENMSALFGGVHFYKPEDGGGESCPERVLRH